MGTIFDRLPFSKRGGRRNIDPSDTFQITQQGREKLQEFNADPKSQILMVLETRGSSTLDEIASASGLPRGQVERLLPMLMPHYVQCISSSSGITAP